MAVKGSMLGGAPSVLTAPWFRAAFLSRQQLLARDPGPRFGDRSQYQRSGGKHRRGSAETSP